MDLVAELPPTVKIYGMDIESSRFPATYPQNVSFSIGSVLSLPKEWAGKFDFVHQRLLMGGLKREDWPVAIGEIFQALKPGGWAQLGEYGFWGHGTSPATDVMFTIYSRLFKRNGLVLRVFAELPDLMREAGFRNVQAERGYYRVGGEKGKAGLENLVNHFQSMKPQILKLGMLQSEEEIDAAIAAMKKELEQLEDVQAEVVYVWAQKL